MRTTQPASVLHGGSGPTQPRPRPPDPQPGSWRRRDGASGTPPVLHQDSSRSSRSRSFPSRVELPSIRCRLDLGPQRRQPRGPAHHRARSGTESLQAASSTKIQGNETTPHRVVIGPSVAATVAPAAQGWISPELIDCCSVAESLSVLTLTSAKACVGDSRPGRDPEDTSPGVARTSCPKTITQRPCRGSQQRESFPFVVHSLDFGRDLPDLRFRRAKSSPPT